MIASFLTPPPTDVGHHPPIRLQKHIQRAVRTCERAVVGTVDADASLISPQ